MITSPDEISRMEALVERANGLDHNDRGLQTSLNSITTYIETCKQSKFSPPPFLANRGLGGIAVPFLVPIVGVLVALGSLGESPGAGFFLLLMFGLIGFWVFKLFWVPGWKRNQRSLK